jgi:hypothetical protein
MRPITMSENPCVPSSILGFATTENLNQDKLTELILFAVMAFGRFYIPLFFFTK